MAFFNSLTSCMVRFFNGRKQSSRRREFFVRSVSCCSISVMNVGSKMTSVFHFRRHLDAPPVAAEVQGIGVRDFEAPDDIGPWLRLRDRAMIGQTPGVRRWTESDFESE